MQPKTKETIAGAIDTQIKLRYKWQCGKSHTITHMYILNVQSKQANVRYNGYIMICLCVFNASLCIRCLCISFSLLLFLFLPHSLALCFSLFLFCSPAICADFLYYCRNRRKKKEKTVTKQINSFRRWNKRAHFVLRTISNCTVLMLE